MLNKKIIKKSKEKEIKMNKKIEFESQSKIDK